jgi:hypothetical protein
MRNDDVDKLLLWGLGEGFRQCGRLFVSFGFFDGIDSGAMMI